MGSGPVMSHSEMQRIYNLYMSGLPSHIVGEIFNRHPTSVLRAIKRIGGHSPRSKSEARELFFNRMGEDEKQDWLNWFGTQISKGHNESDNQRIGWKDLWTQYPEHFTHFSNLIYRSKRFSECDYNWSRESFLQFIEDIGDIPTNMLRPTVGRYDHSKGYIKGNFRWQEHFDNTSEGAKRRFNK
jgi:hypothetical protein